MNKGMRRISLRMEIDFKLISMKKGESGAIKRLKLEDYDIGRTLGKGRSMG